MRVQFLAEARGELAEAKAYYNRERPGLGNDFVREVRATAGRVGRDPNRWAQIDPGVRCCQTHRFPYGLIYIIRKNTIIIVAVMHLHREPGYWKGRL